MSEEILEDEIGKYYLIPCNCPCHTANERGEWIMHCFPCCQGGINKQYIELYSNPLREVRDLKSYGI